METKELEEFLLVKLGLSSPSDKHSFRHVYNYVFDPFVKMPPFEQRSGSSGSPPQQPEPEPEIKAFLAVFRKHFRNPTVQKFLAACEQAEAAFTKTFLTTRQSAGPSSQMMTTPDELSELEAKLRTQIRIQKNWIMLVEYARRNRLRNSARQDALEGFKGELSDKFCFDSVQFYSEADIRSFSKGLETKIVDGFSNEINVRFLKKPVLLGWCADLRTELSQLVTDALQKNRQNRESVWNQKTEEALVKFKEMMERFLRKHPFGKKEVVDRFRAKVKAKCEREQGLSTFLGDSPLKSAWDARVEAEFRGLEKKWEAGGDAQIKSFLETVKVETQKAFRQEFNFELEGGELERMFSQVGEVARRNLEKADETKSGKEGEECTSEDESNDEEPTIPPDRSSSNGDEGDVEMEISSKSSLASIGIELENGYKIIIPSNTKLPTEAFRNCGETVLDYQTSGSADIYEGDDPQAETSRKLGQIVWTDLLAAKEGIAKLEYAMKIDSLGWLHVEWGVTGSRRKGSAQFKTSAWKGNQSDGATTQGSSDPKNNKRSMTSTTTTGLAQTEGASSSKKAKVQEANNTLD